MTKMLCAKANEDRRSNTYSTLLLRKKLYIETSILFFCKFLQNKGLSQNVGLFHLEIELA